MGLTPYVMDVADRSSVGSNAAGIPRTGMAAYAAPKAAAAMFTKCRDALPPHSGTVR
ncbi:hypothetical protein [Streptomyces sp. D54]|uniref:hypothetical protein n=1 Tax=Streptomyces sp. D54 TaxID=1290289 RepID=UPI003CEBB0C8